MILHASERNREKEIKNYHKMSQLVYRLMCSVVYAKQGRGQSRGKAEGGEGQRWGGAEARGPFPHLRQGTHIQSLDS